MGTHPIFESDFDCLTVMKLFVVGRVTNRAVQRNYHQIPINYGLADWWGVAGKAKPLNQIEKFDHTKRADCQFKGKYCVYPEDVKAPAGLEPHQFNVIDADAPPSSEMGAMVQYESVVNSKEIPGWYRNFNAWKFRQDHPAGNASRVGCLVDDQVNMLDARVDAMRDRMYDEQRQDFFYRCERAEMVFTRKETLPYEQWAPISADHRYLNATGRQYFAEQDEEYMLDKITTGTTKVRGGIFAPWTRLRNLSTMKTIKAKVDNTILRSQF